MLENRQVIKYDTEEEWLELRSRYYTSTVAPALFGLSPYTTAFEVYHARKSGVQVPFQPNERTEKGKRLEAAIAQEVSIMTDWPVEPFKKFVVIPGTKIGSSFDYKILHHEWGWVPLEIKAVDYFIHKNQWTEGQAPDHVELQLQHQMLVANASHGMIAAATGIYDIHLYEREYDAGVGTAIHKAVNGMEERIAASDAPAPDFTRDASVIELLFNKAEGEVDKTGDIEIEGLAAKYKRLKAEASVIDKELEALKAELHFKLQNAATVYTDGFKIDVAWTKGSAGTTITQEMVGTLIGERKGYRKCLVKGLK